MARSGRIQSCGHGRPGIAAKRKVGCADSSFPRLSHAGSLAVIRDLGFEAVDVCVFAGYDHTPPDLVAADPRAAALGVGERVAAAGLVVADVIGVFAEDFDQLAVNSPDAAVREESLARFQELLEFSRALGAPGLTILPGAKFDGVPTGVSMRLAAAELARRAVAAGEAGLALSVEPLYGSIADTPAATAELLELAPDVSLSLDYSHFVFQGIPQEDVDPLCSHARHVHLRQAEPSVMQARTSEGSIDFARVLGALDAVGYDGYLTVEYQCEEWLECRRVDCVTEAAEMRDLILGVDHV